MEGLLLILVGALGGLFMRDRLDLALKIMIGAMIILILWFMGSQHS
jgi:hypothetical protein